MCAIVRIVRHKLAIPSYKVQTGRYKLAIASYKVRIARYKLTTVSYKTRTVWYKVAITRYKVRIVSYEVRIAWYKLAIAKYKKGKFPPSQFWFFFLAFASLHLITLTFFLRIGWYKLAIVRKCGLTFFPQNGSLYLTILTEVRNGGYTHNCLIIPCQKQASIHIFLFCFYIFSPWGWLIMLAKS